ncbi:hypothetical protein Tasa_008_001 [Tanticharoenia sakaeratensis NBRC 103193]|uniref:Uncharacterized protein n=2 Tax=Tanticharoenia TaxID=444052 RepID=A0A0D6MI66_9PROT|nr:hypothetical protein Tasa_008_001 [Tanticharoenia sakaeratensis NBRC 103193]GBQ24055.1 hypothetical protein AA103193_2618 [Tanticharoenia sakaeratensis NBRC 103193]
MGERGDIIKRLHRALKEKGIDRAASSWVVAGEQATGPVIGRLVDRGLDDELKGSAWAIVDGVDGHARHIRLPTLDAASDAPAGAIVELRRFESADGRRRAALAVRSDLAIGEQVTARGATWLDRQLIAREPVALGDAGFGAELRDALARRRAHLVEQGIARQEGEKVFYPRGMLATLQQRERDDLASRLERETGLIHSPSVAGEYVTGTYRRRFTLGGGRMAMIDDGLQFQLVPWTPSLERKRGQHVSGVGRDDDGVDWSFGRKRDMGIGL